MVNRREPYYLTGPFGRPLSGITIAGIGEIWELPPSTIDVLHAIGSGTVSTIIVNPRSGVGKTLLLEALLSELPSGRSPLFLRGMSERFEWSDDPDAGRQNSILVANEISNHMRFYLWGAPAQVAVRLAREGWTLWGTVHASSADDLINDWTRAGIVESRSKLPDRLVVIAIDAGETFSRRVVSFEFVEHGVPLPVDAEQLVARLRQTGS